MDVGYSDTGTMGSGVSGFFVGLLIGVAAGGIITLLYAPKSGPETREQFKNEFMETQRMLERWSIDVRERANRFSQLLRFRSEEELQPAGNGQRDL